MGRSKWLTLGFVSCAWLGACGSDGGSTGASAGNPETDSGGTSSVTSTVGSGGPAGVTSTVGSGGNGSTELPSTCFAGSADCDPRTNEGCAIGHACDVGEEKKGTLKLLCYPPPNESAAGAPCNLHGGPFCQGGLVCGPAAKCIPFCCSNDECTSTGEICNPLSAKLGTLGGCIRPTEIPNCGPAGAPCSANEDCCSKDCHKDHCH